MSGLADVSYPISVPRLNPGKIMKPFQSLLAVVVVVAASAFGSSAYACSSCGQPEAVCCEAKPVCCEAKPVCCKPAPPVNVTLCVVDPVTCCSYSVNVCVPAECAGVEPRLVSCHRGVFGRKVLTYKWDCCNHCVEVVITKHGRTIVR